MSGARFDSGVGGGSVGDGPLLTVSGEIDLANADELHAALADLVAAAGSAGNGTPVVVDLTEVGFLGSAGIKVLFDHALRHPLVLVVPTDGIVAPVVALSGLAEVATVR